jgi:hypothetical protein
MKRRVMPFCVMTQPRISLSKIIKNMKCII